MNRWNAVRKAEVRLKTEWEIRKTDEELLLSLDRFCTRRLGRPYPDLEHAVPTEDRPADGPWGEDLVFAERAVREYEAYLRNP